MNGPEPAPLSEQRLEERFLALVGHEIRTPITVIGGWLDLLAGDQAGEQRDQAIAALRRALARLEGLADDLADLAAVTVGDLELDRDLLALNEVVTSEIEDLGDPGVDADLPSVTPVVRGDRRRIGRAVRELLVAQRQRTEAVLQVVVKRDTDRGHAEVSVSAPGSTPDADALGRLFRPFENWEGAGAAGLGLFLCRAVASVHDGEAGVRVGGDNLGLWLRLPDRSAGGRPGASTE